MEEDFLNWHKLKSSIDGGGHRPLFDERDVWWCSVGLNIGVEENGKNKLFERPVIVFKKFNKDMSWCLPLSSKDKRGKYYLNIVIQGEQRTVLLSQLRLLSSKRLTRRMGKITHDQFSDIKKAIINIIKNESVTDNVSNGFSGA